MTASMQAGRITWRPVVWALIGLALLTPAIAMQFTREVNWTATDFIAAAVLLGGGYAAFEIAARRMRSTRGRVAAGAIIGLVVAAIWVQGAVGIV